MSIRRSVKRPRLSLGSSNAKRLALRLAFKGARSFVKSRRTKSNVREPMALTFQHDARNLYRRRPAPRRVKARMRSRSQFMTKVVTSMLPMQLYAFPFSFGEANVVGQQAYRFFPVYTGYNPLVTGPLPGDVFEANANRQLYQIFEANRASGVANLVDQQLQFNTCIADLIINADAQNTAVALVTVYHLWCRRNSEANAHELFENGIFAKQTLLVQNPTGTTQLNPSFLGTVPFDSSMLCSNFIIKNVREFRLGAGTNVTLQLRDRKEYVIQNNEIVNSVVSNSPTRWSSCLAKYTEGYFVFWRGMPNSQSPSPVTALTFNFNVRYRYRHISNAVATATTQLTYPAP